jgi:hypothetical protein
MNPVDPHGPVEERTQQGQGQAGNNPAQCGSGVAFHEQCMPGSAQRNDAQDCDQYSPKKVVHLFPSRTVIPFDELFSPVCVIVGPLG